MIHFCDHLLNRNSLLISRNLIREELRQLRPANCNRVKMVQPVRRLVFIPIPRREHRSNLLDNTLMLIPDFHKRRLVVTAWELYQLQFRVELRVLIPKTCEKRLNEVLCDMGVV